MPGSRRLARSCDVRRKGFPLRALYISLVLDGRDDDFVEAAQGSVDERHFAGWADVSEITGELLG
jgi:hypothetical protein